MCAKTPVILTRKPLRPKLWRPAARLCLVTMPCSQNQNFMLRCLHPPLAPSSANHVTTHLENQVNVNLAMPSIQMNMMAKGHSLVTRALWFFLVGWWLSAIFIVFGVFFTWTVILMPLGFWFINRIPKVQTLRERTRQFKTEFNDNAIVLTESKRDQYPWYARAPYALTVGAVAGILWLSVAWLFGILIVTLPLSIWMIDRSPAIMTLEKN